MNSTNNFANAREGLFLPEAEAERQRRLRYFEGMDRVNRAMQGTNDLDEMMRAVLDTVLDLFSCDRAFLMFPCDPESATWFVPMERTRPEYPGVKALRVAVPMDPEVAGTLRVLLAAGGPVAFGPGTEHPLPVDVSARFGFRSFLSTAIYPLAGKPWQFGIHQCGSARVWSEEEKLLLREIGRRLSDSLSTLLANRDLRESESLYRSLVTNMADGVLYQVAGGEIIAANPAAAKIFGLPGEELRRQSLPELAAMTTTEDGLPFPAEQHPCLIALATGERQSQVTMGVRPASGTLTWVSVNSQPLFTPGLARPYAVVTTFHDITQRKRAEELVRQRELEFRTLAENLPANLARYDLEGRLIYCNRALAQSLGFPEQITQGRLPDTRPWSEGQFLDYRRVLRQVIATGERRDLEINIPGTEEVHLIRFAPELDANGRISGAIAIGRDITGYKRDQAQLQAQAGHLAESNSALKVLLRHSQEAEVEIKKKCLFNIESLILPYLDQLGTLGLSPEGHVCLDLIRANIRGLAISNMSKLSTPALGLTPREVAVADLIRKDYASKEIADFLRLSPGTVEFYRDQIRGKLGLKKQKINLKMYLQTHFHE